jgi:hypothetical protein
VLEVILRKTLRSIELDTVLSVELFSERISTHDAENSAIDVQVLRDIEILPGVVFRLVIRERKFVALEEDALWDTSILNTRLNDVKSVVFEVVENDAVADAEVLIRILDNWLLEVCLELKYLSVILEPLGRNLRNGVIHLGLTVWNT